MIYRTILSVMLLTGSAAAPLRQDPAAAFEVASVKLTPRADWGAFPFRSPYGSNRYIATNVPLRFLVQVAYGVSGDQIAEVEKLGSEHNDVQAKAQDGVVLGEEELRSRLQRLLQGRFKLAAHRELKVFDGYAMVAAKGGPKLKRADGPSGGGSVFPGGLRYVSITLPLIATFLRPAAGGPVVDKTGIKGNYEFDLKYELYDGDDSHLPSFFTALQEKYGLKLEPAKVPLEIVVIEQVDTTPTEN
jgi:uncharacterized protein (TIGR03435 family)